MNIQQFQYILAVSELKHFEKAADKCFVTQSTLSTMIGKFEDEIGIKIFDRKTKPVSTTKEGKFLLTKIKIILKEIDSLKNKIQELKGEMVGELNIGIIPTVAPYLLPLFLHDFARQFPNIKLVVQEMTTANIQKALKKREIDIGIVAIPLQDNELKEIPLYCEQFLLFDCYNNYENNNIDISKIDYSRMYLLEEGHCLRTQIEEICNLSDKQNSILNIDFKAGSIDSLIRFIKANKGLTLLPYLATKDMPNDDKKFISKFESPIPYRTIGLLVHKHFVKINLLEEMKKTILKNKTINSLK